MKNEIFTIAFCLFGLCTNKPAEKPEPTPQQQHLQSDGLTQQEKYDLDYERFLSHTVDKEYFKRRQHAGSYLSSRFAQGHHDWSNANKYILKTLSFYKDPENSGLEKRAMLLALGAGEYSEAAKFAQSINDKDESDISAVSSILLTLEALKNDDFEKAEAFIKETSDGGVARFMKPVIAAWIAAHNGEYNVETLDDNSVHSYHKALIAKYLGKSDLIEPLVDQALAENNLKVMDIERLADLLTSIGKIDRAQQIYEEVLKVTPEHIAVKEKLETLNNSKDGEASKTKAAINFFEGPTDPKEAIVQALYDMSRILYNEGSDESAQIFAHMVLFLSPENTDAYIVLGSIAASNEHPMQAIEYYSRILPDHESYIETRHQIANIYEEEEQYQAASKELQALARDYNDIESMIKIGDIERRQEHFAKAIESYNRAEKAIGKASIPDEYWHLYYVRGMAYERSGQWDMAQKNLEKALEYRPDHPYLLNYLGYAWADQGENLDEALAMIQMAVALKPTDGYITDSLGWVNYRMGNTQNAVKYMERAVALLPYDPVVNDHLGDVYWSAGRKLEARFQWERAKNNIDQTEETEAELLPVLADKLKNGLKDTHVIKEAKTHNAGDNTPSNIQ